MASAQTLLIRANDSAPAAADTKPALSVAMIYQDALTRQWAEDSWNRVGQLVESGGVQCQSWRVGELAETITLAQAVQAGAEADVLVIAVHDRGELPLFLHLWIDAWLPRRAGRAGALLALIGVPARPDSHAGGAHRYLEAVARRAGLDFLPRELKLPEEEWEGRGEAQPTHAVRRSGARAEGTVAAAVRVAA